MKKKSFLRYPIVFAAVFLAAVMSLSALQVFASYPVIPNSVSGLTIAYGSYCEISNQTETGFDVTVSGYKDSNCNKQSRTGIIYFANNTSEDIKISFDYSATPSGGSWSGKIGETAMKNSDTVKGLVIPVNSRVEMAMTSPVGEGTSVKVSVTNLASVEKTSYTLTIPAKLDVHNAGWNATDGIGATGVLESGKKLTVTADSNGEYALVSGENKVNYKLAENGDKDTTYDNAIEQTSWEFTSLSETATMKSMGIVVEDYSAKPAGTYTDVVTFKASVEDVPKTITIDGISLTYADGDTWEQIAAKNPGKIEAITEFPTCIIDGENRKLYVKSLENTWSYGGVDPSDVIDSSRVYAFFGGGGS